MTIAQAFIFIALSFIIAVSANNCPPETPFLCGNHGCVQHKSDCEGFEGCTSPEKPYFCSDGKCAVSFRKCEYKFYPCPKLTDKKCGDGICRPDCEGYHSSACSFYKPIRCADGSCASSLIECASHLCPGDAPYRCKNNDCVETIESCSYPLNIYVAHTVKSVTDDSPADVAFKSQAGIPLADMHIPTKLNVQITGVALSQVAGSHVRVNEDHDVVYMAFFGHSGAELTPSNFIRSAIFEIRNHADPIDPSIEKPKMNLSFKIKVDELKPLQNFDKIQFSNVYCLGELKNKEWRCVSGETGRARRKAGEFTVNYSGTYAVIFYPDNNTPTYVPGAYCGYLCQSKRYFFVFWFLLVPILGVTFYIFFNLLNLQTQVSNVTTENYFLRNKMDELENVQVDFTGQTVLEKLDEGVQYFNNPLRNEEQESIEEFKVLNQKLQQVKEEARRVNSNRNKLISSNKNKLEEIKALRNKLGEYA